MKFLFAPGLLRFFFLLLLGAASLATTSCKKDEPEIQDYSARDQGLIKDYLTANNITTAQEQASGLYFLPVRTNPNATKVAVGSYVSVLYTAHLLDAAGTVFDASSRHNNLPVTFVVGAGQLISGFEQGISLMHIGDKAELLIPSRLAYGASTGNGLIPANSVVRFEVEVVDYKAVDDNLITSYLTSKNITTAQKQTSGLYFLPVVTNANAVRPAIGSTVVVQYTGHLLDAAGTVFDASTPSSPLTFTLGRGQLIAGFEEGIALMHKGDKAELLIPSGLAYGPQGASTRIAPNTVLRFEVEVVDVR
ncbi:FKBP-type peptidyl-prolyl cis-trans isomerase [Hymenobacter properus]|uniref:Peptidyl-prolyl cis-trans isomerase n=1 Tax=Hymenobacter properus TaxID=2791026 RepID=A0A931FLB1_9BACT|nr:FKBP-type peptidyl-prolyl cis-trans isomerase [Hymenobacter properus]MBF9140534.1 FKBP-type peptidyl-prolyl cis-trans isomerase [Hymenobacter properus]MBR7719341.1 FKBP-type peptidyl-prolyl cis-trans isomerase [Microvirga sp. SRT04]